MLWKKSKLKPEYCKNSCVDDDDTDDDDDYDDDVYVDDCVDIEEDGGEIDLDISKIVDISLREKLVESYLLLKRLTGDLLVSLSIRFSPIFCPSSTIPIVDLDLPLEEADVPSFSDDSILRGENVVLDEEEDTFTFTTRSFLPFVTYPEVLPTSYSTGSEDKVFKPGFLDFGRFMVQDYGRTKQCSQFPLMVSNLLFIKKGYQRQKEQKRAKTDKKRKRQVQERNLKPIAKAGKDNKPKKVNEDPIEVKGLIMTSLQSLRALLDVLKSKDQN
ncbi:hypothetical protein Tco_1121691 [Tanacetum coccineum]|uniref:Uncharacterized protein n=1 Tax=Tanacetum coccineum TaxID=301880 RepID=A0ABQ5IYF1_9ASTR